MNKQDIYRALLRVMPKPNYGQDETGPYADIGAILRRWRTRGAVVAVFGQEQIDFLQAYGQASDGVPVAADTFFRIASVSKMVTALAVLRLAQQNQLDLDADTNKVLSFAVRHPAAPQRPITLAMLLSHTAGLHDGRTYIQALGRAADAQEILAADSYTAHLPGEGWEYSNLGAGLVGSVLEALLDKPFETIMQQTLFAPLGVRASFYAQQIKEPLADAQRVFPPARRAAFDASARQSQPLGDALEVVPQRHYAVAHGTCCINAQGMITLARALMAPGFLSADWLAHMRRPCAPFGRRSPSMRQGLGIFLIDETGIDPDTIYGHQGNAYGAVHGVFFKPSIQRGMLFFSSGTAQSKTNFLADVNRDLLRRIFAGR